MYKSIGPGAVVACALMLPATTFAQEWAYSLTPYLWASALNGTQGVGGRTQEIDAGFSDIVEFVDVGLAAHFEAKNDPWGYFVDAFYVKLSDEVNRPRASIRGETKQGIYEAGFSYTLNERLEGLAGLRHQRSDIELGSVRGARTIGTRENWTDGFVGLRYTAVDSDDWRLWLRGDAGAGDSDFTWQVQGGLSYRFNDRTALVVAYRYLDTDYENGGFTWDMAQSGLGLGLEINW